MADRLSIERSPVSRLCAALERKHLIMRTRDANDRRNLRLCLTESGDKAGAHRRPSSGAGRAGDPARFRNIGDVLAAK